MQTIMGSWQIAMRLYASIHRMVMYGSYRYHCSQVTLCITWSLLCNQRRVLLQGQIESGPEKHEAPFNTQLRPRMSPSPAKVVAHLMLFTTKSLGLPDMVKRTKSCSYAKSIVSVLELWRQLFCRSFALHVKPQRGENRICLELPS